MTTLTPAQQKAVDYEGPYLQIIACAGSGKTEVLARRVVRLLKKGIDPASIIAFTYTKKAALELKNRIEKRAALADPQFAALPPAARGMFIGTTHAWAYNTLRDTGGNYELMDPLTEEGEWALLLRVARRLGVVDLYQQISGGTGRVGVAPAIDHFLQNLEVVYNERIDRGLLQQKAPDFHNILHKYEDLLRDIRLMPFRSMIEYAVRELGEGGRLFRKLNGRIRHVLVDEYQDLNQAQNEMLKRLAGSTAHITIVGDDDQAIYQWRGGNAALFTHFDRQYPDVKRLKLDKNHRCHPQIVHLSRILVERLEDRLKKKLEASREQNDSRAIEVFVSETPESEAAEIARRIEKRISQGHPPGDIAILYRSVRTSARPLIEALRTRNIPCFVAGKTSMLAQEEVRLIIRIFVKWTGNSWFPQHRIPDPVSDTSLLNQIQDVCGTGQRESEVILEELKKTGDRIKNGGVDDIIRVFNEVVHILRLPSDNTYAGLQEHHLGQLSRLLARFDHAIRRAIPASFYQTTEKSAREEALEDRAISEDDEGSDHKGVNWLGIMPGELYLIRLKKYLESFASRAAEDPSGNDPDFREAVHIMTIHQSKGLEFPIVFVPCLVEGRFPVKKPGQTYWHIPKDVFDRSRYEGTDDDERRLAYVAMTRAKELAVLSCFGKDPSRFLVEYIKGASEQTSKLCILPPQLTSEEAPDELLDLSFSKLTTFLECGYRYWLRHICGFRSPRAPQLGFGKALHHVIAELARCAMQGDLPDKKKADQILSRDFYLPFAGPVPDSRLREAARHRIRHYLQHYGEELIRTRRPEFSFEVPLENVRIRGRVDLILHTSEKDPKQVALIDFKTSVNRPRAEFHRNQLRLYADAARRMGWEPVSLAIHDLDANNGKRIFIPPDETEQLTFAHQLRYWANQISKGEFIPTNDPRICRGCDFRQVCRHSPQRR